MEWLLLLWALSTLKAPKPGQITIIKARDGSSHRVQYLTAVDNITGKSATGWVALSTDTGLRFKEGEDAEILGRLYHWRKARTGTPFSLGVFM